jgi:hypothetical protein
MAASRSSFGALVTTFSLLFVVACRSKAVVSSGDYRTLRAKAPISLDAPDDSAWGRAERIAWGTPGSTTAFRALWDERGLLVRFDVEDAEPWHTLARHDDRLWEEEVVEIFLQPAGAAAYGEVEISPGNVTCDVWVTPNPRSFDGKWNLEGLESRVTPRRDEASHTTGWTAIAFLPWAGFARGGVTAAPRPRDRWRFNVFRIERPGGHDHPEEGALLLAWSPTGERTFHVVEAFRGMVFDD